MRLKICGGTVDHGQPSLCVTCRFATIVKGQRLRDEIVECSRLDSRRITFAVAACSGYSDSRRSSVREMEEIAWVLRSDANTKQIGFVPARKLKPEGRCVLPGEWDQRFSKPRIVAHKAAVSATSSSSSSGGSVWPGTLSQERVDLDGQAGDGFRDETDILVGALVQDGGVPAALRESLTQFNAQLRNLITQRAFDLTHECVQR